MSPTRIGHVIRRLRQEKKLTQQALAARLGISASYLNLIEHNQRSVTAGLLIKLTRALDVSLETLAGTDEQRTAIQLREALSDPLLGAETVPLDEITTLAAQPNAAATVLALHRAFRAARQDAAGMMLPTGKRIMLPQEEARLMYEERRNYFSELEDIAETIRTDLVASAGLKENFVPTPAEMNQMIAARLRQHHKLTVRVTALPSALRQFDPTTRTLLLSSSLPRESRSFQMAFQLVRLEVNEALDALTNTMAPSSDEARMFIHFGLLNYTAAAILMPYDTVLSEATNLRYDLDLLSSRFAVSYHQMAQRLSTLQKPGARGVPLYFARIDMAGNITKSFSACGFPIARHGASCPQWSGNTALLTPGTSKVEIAQLPDGRRFLCFARAIANVATGWGTPQPIHVIAMGCNITHASEIVYGDFLNLEAEPVKIGVSCHLCDWKDCNARAFPPLHHRLSLDTNEPDSFGPVMDAGAY